MNEQTVKASINIDLTIKKEKCDNTNIELEEGISIIPFNVPHRNELSETVGFQIKSYDKSILYIPDIDSWDKWEKDINQMIKENDIAFLDGTYYDKTELKNRDINEIPHPSIKDSIKKIAKIVKQLKELK